MKIAVIGSGNIGGTLGKKWAAAGHDIQFGVRNPEEPKYKPLLDDIEGEASLTTLAEAAAYGEVVLLAIPGQAVDNLAASSSATLDGKIILDATNRVGEAQLNSFAALAQAAPQAKLFRAFSTLGWENFETPEINGEQVDLFYCGDEDNKSVVEGLITAVGLRPVYVGGREQVGVVDGLTRLWFTMVFQQGHGRRLAFKMQAA